MFANPFNALLLSLGLTPYAGIAGAWNSGNDETQVVLTAQSSKQANLDFTSPAPHVFSSLRYLLEQLPNTYIPNGHSIVPCQIPAYNTLYHGRRDGKLPPNPEWFAFDVEMSYGIMGSSRDSHMLTYQTTKPVQCLYFDGMSAALMGSGTLDSQLVFLCGNTTCSSDDSRNGFRGVFDEYTRAERLCEWVQENDVGGLGWGVEGFVRMNAGFEMIWCNFSSPSIRLVSRVNVTAPTLPEGFWDEDSMAGAVYSGIRFGGMDDTGPIGSLTDKASTTPMAPSTTTSSDEPTGNPDMPPPPNWRNQRGLEPFLVSQSYEWYRSALWHLGTSGSGSGKREARVRLHTCGFLSFYDPKFVKFTSGTAREESEKLNLTSAGTWKGEGEGGNRSSALHQLARRRRSHTLTNMENEEAEFMNKAMTDVLRNDTARACTGADWNQVTSDIAIRYSGMLHELLNLTSNGPATRNSTIQKSYMNTLRSRTHAVLVPFLEYPPTSTPFNSSDSHFYKLESMYGQAAFQRCKYQATFLLRDPETHDLLPYVSAAERTIINSIEAVLHTICNTTISLTLQTEYEWQIRYNINSTNATTTSAAPSDLPKAFIHQSSESLGLLLAWLGWFPDSHTCRPACSADEFCFFPIWPLTFLSNPGNQFPGRGGGRYGRPRRGYGRRPYGPPPPSLSDRPGFGRGPTRNGTGRGPPRRGGGPGFRDNEEELWNPTCVKIQG